MSDERRCIYCTELKALDAFSTEHIIPKFLGGNAECAAAATDAVCKDCNSLFGRFVDAAVAKGYFLNSIEQGAWRGCFDYGQLSGNVYPLTYFGKSTELKVGPREDVEVWLCPDGGTAWHIHTKHPEDFNSLAGGDPVLRRKDDSSRVYSFNASSHPYWILSNLKSVLAHFTEEPIYIGADSDLEDTLPTGRNKGVFNRKDEVALHERDQIFELINQPDLRQHLIQMDVLFDARFLAKMAIAFGFKILGSKYLDLRYTERLRNLLWTRRKNLDLVEHDVRMKTYFAGLQDRSLMPLSFPHGFVFLIKAFQEGMILGIIFPSGHYTQVSITDPTVDPDTYDLIRGVQEHVLISIPQLMKAFGPIELAHFIAWKGKSYRITELDDVSARFCDRNRMPSLR